MVTRGGEVDFVKKMIDESLHLHDRIQWYTSMLGKLSSVSVLVETLIKHNNQNFAVTEFEQGSKTKRWAVAWSWGDRRPSMVRLSLCSFSSYIFERLVITNWCSRLPLEGSPTFREVFCHFLRTTLSHYHWIHLSMPPVLFSTKSSPRCLGSGVGMGMTIRALDLPPRMSGQEGRGEK